MAMDDMHKKFDEDWTCSSEDMIADRQTNKHTDTHRVVTNTKLGNKR